MNSSAAPRIVPAARGMGLWFVASGNNLRGPFLFEELVVELDSLRVSPGDFCWRQGFQEWRPVCSVEEFGISRERPTLLSPYPSVPLPSSGAIGRRSADRRNNPLSYAVAPRKRAVEERRVVKLRVQKNLKSTVTWFERIGFFFFTILTSYLSVWVVTSEAELGLDKKVFIRNLGQLESFGTLHNQENAIPFFAAGPIFSSPGYSNYSIAIDVRLDGAFEKIGIQSFAVAGQRVQGARPFEEWSPKKLEIDPLYMRQVEVSGRISSAHPGVVRFVTEGEPTEFVSFSPPGEKYQP